MSSEDHPVRSRDERYIPAGRGADIGNDDVSQGPGWLEHDPLPEEVWLADLVLNRCGVTLRVDGEGLTARV